MAVSTGIGSRLRTPNASREPLRRLPRIPALDGLRAFAVTAVLLYHLDLEWIPGGFLGVDVFFVLSGFLITTLIIEEIEHRGRLDFRRFYVRRAVRLLPALWLLLSVIWLVALVQPDLHLGDIREDLRAAFVYVSNWQFIVADTSYFDSLGRPPALQHLWSLAVEEQFYLLWPAIAAVAMLTGRRRVRHVALAGALISTAWMAWLSLAGGFPVPNDPSRAYYGTDSHAMGLLVGAALAASYAPWRTWSAQRAKAVRSGARLPAVRVLDAAGVLALAGVVAIFAWVSEFSPLLYRGGFLLLSFLVALLLMALVHPASTLSRVMGRQPLVYVGRRSYGIYLWHWPIFVVTRPGFELPFGGPGSMVLRVGLTMLAAELSYRLVEQPVRRLMLTRHASRRGFPLAPPRLRLVSVALLVTGVAACTAGVTNGSAGVRFAEASTLATGLGAGRVAAIGGAGPATGAPGSDLPRGVAQRAVSANVAAAGPAAPSKPPLKAAVKAAPLAVSAFGDSVMRGAEPALRRAGISVTAHESIQFEKVSAAVREALKRGRLGHTVVIHAGNNGAIAETSLRHLLETTRGRRTYLLSVKVPRRWESYDNKLFVRVARDYPWVRVLDWRAVASANPKWLYGDHIHLTPNGARGYAAWLTSQLTRYQNDPGKAGR